VISVVDSAITIFIPFVVIFLSNLYLAVKLAKVSNRPLLGFCCFATQSNQEQVEIQNQITSSQQPLGLQVEETKFMRTTTDASFDFSAAAVAANSVNGRRLTKQIYIFKKVKFYYLLFNISLG
jgi:hypothetical protein